MSELLRPFSGTALSSPLHIILSGMTYPDPAYRINRPNSEIWVIEYVTGGVGYVSVDGRESVVSEDMIYLLHAGTSHEYHPDAKDPYSKIFMNVSGSLCSQLIASYGLNGKNFFDGNGMKPLFERILANTDVSVPESEAQTALQGLFVEILARLSFAEAEPRCSDEAAAMKEYINSNTGRIVSADELSKLIFRSQDYCLKLFLREFGVTPYAYQLERKLDMAKTMLEQTSMPVAGIAAMLGYSDPHYFSNLFMKKCGVRPLAYRKNRG